MVIIDGQFRVGGAHTAPGGVVVFSVLMLVCAWGMWQLRYWAVLGFQAILAFVVLFFSLLLLRAENLVAVVAGVAVVGGGGYLFYKLVRVLSRLQMPSRRLGNPRRPSIVSGRMPDASYDCVVIGSGPGGYVAAIRAAQLGMKTAVLEKDRVGGRCLNYACIPAKAILRVADVLTEVREAGDFGIKVGEPERRLGGVLARREKVVKTLTGGVSGLFKKNGIEVIEGEGALAGAGNVTVSGQNIAAKAIILATGSVKRSIPGTEFGGRVIGTEEAWALPDLPSTLAVVGAGASGAEIASAYARLGTTVTLFEALDRVLPTEDADISKVVDRGLRRQGITIHTNTFVENIESTETMCRYTHGDQAGEAEWLVIATGRAPDVDALNLDGAGVRPRRRRPDRGRRRDAHEHAGRLRHRRSGARARRSPTRPPTRGSSRSRTRPGSRPTRSSTSTFPEPRSARRTWAASA